MNDRPLIRRNPRLRGYDYATPGAYFVTVCTRDRAPIFGTIVDGVMNENDLGAFARNCWNAISDHHPGAGVDAFVVMPNHVHGIVVLGDRGDDTRKSDRKSETRRAPCMAPLRCEREQDTDGGHHDVGAAYMRPSAQWRPCMAPLLGTVIATFKAAVTRISGRRGIWQRGFHDRILRNDRELHDTRAYILANPGRWPEDEEFVPFDGDS